jgi:hypothetical protein
MSIVANYDIDNASGQTVRLDIQACLKALQSSNSSSADTDLASSACVAGMPFLNTTTKDLKVRKSPIVVKPPLEEFLTFKSLVVVFKKGIPATQALDAKSVSAELELLDCKAFKQA